MIRRSTLVLLTCISALSVPAIQTRSAASLGFETPTVENSVLIAQATSADDSFQPLGIGARGEAVRSLQRRLLETEYYSGPLDGLYGLETQRAVVALQRAAGLEDTGTLNEATWQALEAGPEGTFEFAQTEQEAEAIAESVPVEGEMPAPDAPIEEPIYVEESDGISPLLVFGLGGIALLGSFGVGFYMANKSKQTDDWEATDPEAVGVELETNPVLPSVGSVPPVPVNPALHNGAAVNNPTSQTMASQTMTSQTMANEVVTGEQASQRQVPPAPPISTQGFSPSNGQLGYVTGGSQVGQQIGATGPLSQIDVIEGLLGELHNPDPAKRRKAIWELGQRGNSIAVQPLVDAMPNADSKEKSLLLAALSEIGIRSLKPMNRAMAIAFQDPNPEVRKNAIRDLSRVYDIVVQISHMLGHAAEDEDPEVRQTATWALDKLNMIRKSQDVDKNMRSFAGSGATPIDLLSSEASIRRSQEMR